MTATTVIASKIQPVLHGSPSRSGSTIIDGSALAETLTSIAHKVNVIFIVDSSTLPTWMIPQTTTPAQRLAASFAHFTRCASLSRIRGQVGRCNVLLAYLGLVPRQASSRGKERLLGISKRGDGYLRSLLIHGARAVIHHIRRRLRTNQPGGNPRVEQLLQRCRVNEAAGTLANRIARTAWALVAKNEIYCPARPV